MTSIEDTGTRETPDINTYSLITKSKHDQFMALSESEKRKWLSRELTYWQEISLIIKEKNSPSTRQTIHSKFTEEIAQYIQKLQAVDESFEPGHLVIHEAGSIVDRESNTLHIFETHLPQHDDALATEFKSACLSGAAASAIYAYKTLVKNPETDYYRGFNSGLAENLRGITTRVDGEISDSISELNKKKDEVTQSLQSTEEKIKAILTASKAAISLSEPVKFWEDRKDLHKKSAKRYGRFALFSGVLFAAILATVVVNEYSSGISYSLGIYSLTLPKTLSGIALILLISTAGIWSTRIFVKLMMANLTMESESIERATMIKTFVAMKAVESSMVQEAELLFYTTLFRPSNNVINEESTAPEFGKLLEAVLKAKSDKAEA